MARAIGRTARIARVSLLCPLLLRAGSRRNGSHRHLRGAVGREAGNLSLVLQRGVVLMERNASGVGPDGEYTCGLDDAEFHPLGGGGLPGPAHLLVVVLVADWDQDGGSAGLRRFANDCIVAFNFTDRVAAFVAEFRRAGVGQLLTSDTQPVIEGANGQREQPGQRRREEGPGCSRWRDQDGTSREIPRGGGD